MFKASGEYLLKMLVGAVIAFTEASLLWNKPAYGHLDILIASLIVGFICYYVYMWIVTNYLSKYNEVDKGRWPFFVTYILETMYFAFKHKNPFFEVFVMLVLPLLFGVKLTKGIKKSQK